MYGKFLVEGDKLVRELLLSSIKIEAIFRLKGWECESTSPNLQFFEVSEIELKKI